MDFTLSLSSDWFNLISLPLIAITIKDLIPKWSEIWDKNLSNEDRRLLMRMVMFLVLPVVVLIHETGHLLAALQVGAKVYEFHYGPLTGFVKVASNIPPEHMIWIAIAGNLAQIVVGFIALVLSAIVSSPPMVAFLVYLGLFAIGDTVIFYAALSLASYYGDWQQIYNSPCRNLVFDVGLVHSVLIAFIFYCLNGAAPRLWFTKRTNPEWSVVHKQCEYAANQDPGIVNFMRLANSFVEAGLFKQAEVWLAKADALDPGNPGVAYAFAEMEISRGKFEKALPIYQRLSQDLRLEDAFRAQIFLQMGELHLFRRDFEQALRDFESSLSLDPWLADPRLQSAIMRASQGKFEGLSEEIRLLRSPEVKWVYARNQESAPSELSKLESQLARRKSV